MAHHFSAGVAELADALDLGSSAFGRGGSTPFTRTTKIKKLNNLYNCKVCNVVF